MSTDVYEVLREGVNDNGGVSASDVSLVNPLRACPSRARARDPGAVLRIVDRVRRRFARFKLCAHLLQSRSHRFNLLLLLGVCRFLLFDDRKAICDRKVQSGPSLIQRRVAVQR
jgi:hypothetical protein